MVLQVSWWGVGGIHKQFTRGQASRPCLRSCSFSGTRIQASLTQKHISAPQIGLSFSF